jgi:hypothetical protein
VPITGIVCSMEHRDTYTAREAAKILGMSRRQVLNLLHNELLEGFQEQEGKAWKVFQWSVHNLKDSRPPISRPLEGFQRSSEALAYESRMEELARELGRLEGRLELTEKAESTIREERDRLLEERREAQEEVRRLREELEAERSKGFWQRLFGP